MNLIIWDLENVKKQFPNWMTRERILNDLIICKAKYENAFTDDFKGEMERNNRINILNQIIKESKNMKTKSTQPKVDESKELSNVFEKDLFSLVNSYAKKGLEKPDLIRKLKYVLGSAEMS